MAGGRYQKRRRPVRRLDSTDLHKLFTSARAWFGEPVTTMDLVAAMSRGAREGMNSCGDREAWVRITMQTQLDAGDLPSLLTDAAQSERLGTTVTTVICGEGFRVSRSADRALAFAERLTQQYLVDEVTPWLLAAGIALDDSSGATLALRGPRPPVWLAQLFMRELALCELDGLAHLMQGRPNPPEQRDSAADEEPDLGSASERFFAEASRSVVGSLRNFWSLTPRLCRWRDRAVQATTAVPVAALALSVASPVPAAALTLATAAMISRVKLSLAISAMLAGVAWLIGAPWWASVTALLVGLVMYRGVAVARRPFVGRLSGWRLIFRGPARRRAERLLAHAYPVSALAEYERLIATARGTRRIGLLADAAYAACDSEQYQRALDLATLGLQTDGVGTRSARRYRGRLNVAAAMACVQLAQFDRARAAAKAAHAAFKGTDQRLNHALIAMGEAGEASGHLDAVREIATAAATRALRRLQWVAACEYLIHLGQVFIRKGQPADAWVCFYNARRLATRRYFKDLGEYDEQPAYGAWRAVVSVTAQTEIGMGEAQMLAGLELRPEHIGAVPYPSEGLEELKILERPLDLARAHQICADLERQNGRPDRTIHHLFAALGIIDRNRYLIRDPGTRLRWIKANIKTHRLALAIAHEFNDHAGVCELLEIGRLQGIPADKDLLAVSSDTDIPLQPPPRVMIGGQSHLIDADGVSAESDIVDLQTLTRLVAGENAILLSYWTNEDGCYWSLLGLASIHSGRIDLKDAKLKSALESLHLGLPMPLRGEDNAARNARVLAGPYYSDRAWEEKLAIELSMILPEPLRLHLASLHNGKIASLVICPSPELARVPWPLVAVPEAQVSGGVLRRLLDLADLHLGLTSALNHEVCQRTIDDYTTNVTAVVDPSGEGGSARTEETRSGTELLGAQRMILRLPSSVQIHGGRWLGDGNPTTLARLKEILHATPKGGSFVFVGHCAGPEPGRSAAEAAIVLAPTTALGPPEALNARSLLHAGDMTDPLRFPARVVLAACNSSSADYSDAGEWLSLVPAVHWAGAREVISSTVSVPDRLYRLESSLIRWLNEENDVTLSQMLLTLQRDALRAWRSGENRVPPISWAFYLHSGVPAAAGRTETNEEASPNGSIWSGGAIKKLQDGVRSAIGFRHRVLHTNVVSLAHVGYEVDDAASLAAIFIVYPLFIWELLGFGRNPIPLFPGQKPRFSPDWRRLIDAAEAHARAHHRRLVCEVDVLSVLLEHRNLSGSWIMSRLANVRHKAVREREIREAHTTSQWLHAASPQLLYSAGSKGPRRREAELLAEVGFTEEWLRRNAIARRRASFDRGFGGFWPIQQRNRRDQAINQSRFPPRNV